MTVTFTPIYNEEARKLVTKTQLDSGPAQSISGRAPMQQGAAAGIPNRNLGGLLTLTHL